MGEAALTGERKQGEGEGTWSSVMSRLAHCENKKMNSRLYSS